MTQNTGFPVIIHYKNQELGSVFSSPTSSPLFRMWKALKFRKTMHFSMLYIFCFILAQPILSRSIAREEKRQIVAQACDSTNWEGECIGDSMSLYDTADRGCSRMNQHPQPGNDKGYKTATVSAGSCSFYEYDEYLLQQVTKLALLTR